MVTAREKPQPAETDRRRVPFGRMARTGTLLKSVLRPVAELADVVDAPGQQGGGYRVGPGRGARGHRQGDSGHGGQARRHHRDPKARLVAGTGTLDHPLT